MDNLWPGEIKIFALLSAGFWVFLAIGLPILAFFLFKDFAINFLYWIVIKLNTSYQFQNNFIMDGKNCQVVQISVQNVFITDLDTGDIIQIRNKDFVDKDIWHKPPQRRKWSEEEREVHREKIKDKKKRS